MRIYDIMDVKLLSQMLTQKYVKAQPHPTLPYLIYNYTNMAQFHNVWNDVTEQCRGLIIDSHTGNIIARPFRKFFNYGQPGAPSLPLDSIVHVTDKADGSLGILYPTPGLTKSGYSIATRGSFTSEQAVHATELFNRKYGARWAPMPDYTFLFEIVYPANRIVLDYGDVDDLFMLTAVDNLGGRSIPRAAMWSNWPGPTVQTFEYDTLKDALAAPPRAKAEGLVVHDIRTGNRLKIKQEDYVALHRVITHMSARVIWEYMAVNACRHLIGKTIKRDLHWGTYLGIDPKDAQRILDAGDNWLDRFIDGVPDEFYGWLENTIRDLQYAVVNLERSLELKMHTLAAEASVNGAFDRALFYRLLKSEMHGGIIGLMYDNRDVTAALWKSVRPDADVPFKSISEDVA